MSEFEEIVAWMLRPETYGAAREVRHVETHIAHVFLVGKNAYKLKKPVDLGYLDFTSLDKRRWAFEREDRLNRRTAPDLYEGVHEVRRSEDGTFCFDGPGKCVDVVLKMRRFDDSALLSTLAEKGELPESVAMEAAKEAAQLHAVAERLEMGGGEAGLRSVEVSMFGHIGKALGDVFDQEKYALYKERTDDWHKRLTPLLEERRCGGFVRAGHGDLHLRNIFLENDKPVLFDCIEFSEDLGTLDTLYDLAFLLMDLSFRGLKPCANRALNAYFAELSLEEWRGDVRGLAALPLFLSVRASVRAHVDGEQAEDPVVAERARAYLAYAGDVLAAPAPSLMAIGGLSGTGKSTRAFQEAPERPGPVGALVLRSDEIRKKLNGVAVTDKLPPEAYGPGTSAPVYAEMYQAARVALAGGQSVILDAVFLKEEERKAAEELAQDIGVPFEGLWLEGDADVLAARVNARKGDASDADLEVLRAQLHRDPGEITWRRERVG